MLLLLLLFHLRVRASPWKRSIGHLSISHRLSVNVTSVKGIRIFFYVENCCCVPTACLHMTISFLICGPTVSCGTLCHIHWASRRVVGRQSRWQSKHLAGIFVKWSSSGNSTTFIHMVARSQQPRRLRRGVRPLACWECGFESCRWNGCLLWVLFVVR